MSLLLAHLIKSRLTAEIGKLWTEDAESFCSSSGGLLPFMEISKNERKGEQEGNGSHKNLSSSGDIN